MKQMIWTSEALFDEQARQEYQAFQREALDDAMYKVCDNGRMRCILG